MGQVIANMSMSLDGFIEDAAGGECLNLGLLDAIAVDLVPVLLGTGKPFFAERSEGHRHELHVHCYRMLGSFEKADYPDRLLDNPPRPVRARMRR